MRTVVFFIGFIVGCHSERTEVTASMDGSTELSLDAARFTMPRAEVVDAAVDPLCATILTEDKLDESAMRGTDRARPGPRLHCASTGRVAWAVRVDPPEAGASVRQTLIFAGSDGTRARAVSTLDNVDWPPVLGRHSALFDFDGDGVPEFFTIVPTNLRTFAPASRNFVTFKKGVIAPYPTGSNFLVDGVADIDKDSRPDLRISFELGKRTTCEKSDEGQIKIELAAHSLPDGKFSINDAAATAFASRRCPAMPTADAMFVPSVDPTASDGRDLSLSYVTCSRLRGKSADAVIAEVSAACAPYVDATKQCTGPCRHLPDALVAARFVPPVSLH